MVQAKQFQGMARAALVGLTNISATGGSTVITTALTTALSTAGNDQLSGASASVPLQVGSAGGVGVITATPLNRVKIVANSSKNDIIGANNAEVYGRLTESSNVWTLTYFTLQSGVETAHSFGSATAIDVLIPYRFSPNTFPLDAAIAVPVRNVSDDGTGGTPSTLRIEQANPTALNTLPNLGFSPIAGTLVVNVNGLDYYSTGGSPRFTVSGQTVTWNPSNGSPAFSVTTTDNVVYRYQS